MGALLVNKWKLSPLLEDVILNHHNQDNLTSENPLLLYLDLANRLCRQVGIGFIDDPDIELVDCPANRILGLAAEKFDETIVSLQETLESEMEVFI